ncbi:unnamed protein product [Schistocephalus solidus]|uniref:Reverse transcriptase domain-containing protein n=1 Tax=Schistocephalus solidus TaxID=70667 RepID=A0A183TKI0_SCHSO|nr:unnamed protein product [Schistocephalus solidus]
MQAPTPVSTTTVHDSLFADDCALSTMTEQAMKRSMDLFFADCANSGFTISAEKTVVMHQSPPSAEHDDPRITVNCTQIKIAAH